MDKYVGKRLDGRYEIKEIIGVGGMAYVYKAFDNIDNRTVAIKILKEEYLQNEEFTRRFKNESKAIAILSHPNIVKVYDVSFGERMQYIVMEYIDGITLKEYIEGQAEFKWKEAVHFTVQILRALQHAHDKGIVHRDIKPQNIMLLPDGTIKVADFGIARFSRRDMNATRASDKAIGSVHYISPEQARGEITDEKADIYSVGVMLYEMLTGKLPFEADSAVSVAIMQMQSEAVPPRQVNAAIPEGLEDITVKAMQKDTSKRYQSAAEMLYDIDEFKKNPSIHFEYKYFVDDSPTRYMDTISKVRGGEPVRSSGRGAATEDDEEEKKGFPIIPVLSAIAGAFVLIAAIFVFLVLGDAFGGKTDDVVVPDFVGMTLEEFNNHKDFNKWNTWFDFEQPLEEFSEEPEGTIIEQSLDSGSKVKVGETSITLTVSTGHKLKQVPNVVDQQSDMAQRTLENAGFVVELQWAQSSIVAEGHVISLSPAEYPNELPEGSTITMVISTGSKPATTVKMPNVTKLSKEQAIEQLTKAGFIVNEADIVEVYDPKIAAGTVTAQSIPAETPTPPETVVILSVSTGYAEVPIVIQLPTHLTQSVDLQIYIDNRYYTTVTDLNPSQTASYTAKLRKAAASYTVDVRIAFSGAIDYKPYAKYQCDATTNPGSCSTISTPNTGVLDSVTP